MFKIETPVTTDTLHEFRQDGLFQTEVARRVNLHDGLVRALSAAVAVMQRDAGLAVLALAGGAVVLDPRDEQIRRLKGLILKVLDSWWPFVHGALGASQRAINLRKELSDGIQPGAERSREADRTRFPDEAFNEWLDVGISDAGHTVWDQIGDTCSAWHGWENALLYASDEDDEPLLPAPVTIYTRPAPAGGDSATNSRDVALEWKRRGSVVTPDPEAS